MKWQRKKLGDVIEFLNGKKADLSESGNYVVYGSNGIIGKSNNYRYENAIIIGRVGAYCGSIAYCPNKFWASDNTIVAKPKHNGDVRFFSYFLHNFGLNKYAGGAAQPLVTQTVLKSLEGDIPNPTLQRKIASILSAYDDLIENNTRRIAILEEMARRIYEEWFVRFRFPGHEQVKMVESELGLIPEGWEIKRLEDVLSALESGSRPKGGIDANEREVPSIGAENINGLGNYDYSKDKFISREFFENMNRGVVKSGDVLLYKDGAYIGRKAMFQNDYPHKECAINEHVFILRSGEIPPNYLYFWLDTKEMTAKIKGLNSNAAQPGINQAGVKSLPIMVPNKDVLFDFDERIQPLISLLFNLAKKKALLRKTRDLLLPKLISGEVDVSHFPEPENV